MSARDYEEFKLTGANLIIVGQLYLLASLSNDKWAEFKEYQPSNKSTSAQALSEAAAEYDHMFSVGFSNASEEVKDALRYMTESLEHFRIREEI